MKLDQRPKEELRVSINLGHRRCREELTLICLLCCCSCCWSMLHCATLRLSKPAATVSAKMTHTDECPTGQDLSALNTSFSTALPTSRCSALACPHHSVQHCPAHITLFSTGLPTSRCSALPCPLHKISRSPPVPLCKQLGVKQAKGTKEQN